MKRLARAICAVFSLGACSALAASPPRAPVQPVTDIRYGETLLDPYRWMEKGGPEFLEWAKAQDAATRSSLSALPGYSQIKKEVTAASDAEVKVSNIQRVGDQIYYKKQSREQAQASLYVRPLSGGPERKLVDPVALGGPTTTIKEYSPSPDNRTLSYGLSEGGSEEAKLHFLDVRSGKAFPEVIDRARFAGATWSPDSTVIFYDRLKAHPRGPFDRFADQALYRHRPGEDPDHDVVIGTVKSLGSELGATAFLGVGTQPNSNYAIAVANSGVSPESEWFVAPLSELLGAGLPHWVRIAKLADKADLVPALRGDTAYLAVFKDAPRRQIVKIDLRNPGALQPVVVASERAQTLKKMIPAADGLYAVYGNYAGFQMDRIAYGSDRAERVALPYNGTIAEMSADDRRPGAVFTLESWVRPIRVLQVAKAGVRDLSLAPPFAMDLSKLTAETVYAAAADGVRIPISVLHRTDLRRDGSAPALVDAYGAYGISADPVFNATVLPFLMRGGVLAEAHVRGGGELGEDWHLAGKGAAKPNTWRDFIAAVHFLEDHKFTSPAKVAGMGVSAGGIMIGRAITEAPDLLAAAVMWAPISNTLRFETTEGGPSNVAEFGSTSTKEGYAALREMDPYSHVVDGVRYPAILITTGMNDHRVPPWMPAEMAARLQASSTSGKPVMLRIDFQGGHHLMGVSKDDQIDQTVDTLAFVLQATGDPKFRGP